MQNDAPDDPSFIRRVSRHRKLKFADALHEGTVDSRLIANAQRYLDFLKRERGLSENTIAAYCSDLSGFIFWLPPNTGTINRSHVSKYLAFFKSSGHKPSTLARTLASLRGWFSWEKSSGKSQNDPSDGLLNPQRVRKLPHVLTPNEVAAMIKAAGN